MDLTDEINTIREDVATAKNAKKINSSKVLNQRLTEVFLQASNGYSDFLSSVKKMEEYGLRYSLTEIELCTQHEYDIESQLDKFGEIGKREGYLLDSQSELAAKIEKSAAFKNYAKPIKQAGYNVTVNDVFEMSDGGPNYTRRKYIELAFYPK